VRLPDPNADVANKELGRSLENLLVSKNRRLLDELTKLRVSWEELSAQHIKSEDTVESLQAEVARQRGLNEKLENDLMSLNKEGLERSGGSGIGLAGLDIGGKGVVSVSIVTQAGADDEGGQDAASSYEWRHIHLADCY
jgi:homeobox protein cut-like